MLPLDRRSLLPRFAMLFCGATSPLLAQQLTAAAVTATPIQLQANQTPGVTVPAGTALPDGFLAQDSANPVGGLPSSATFQVSLQSTPLQDRVTCTLVDRAVHGTSPGAFTNSAGVRTHETRIHVASSSPVFATVRVQFTVSWQNTSFGAFGPTGTAVDIGADGSHEMQLVWPLAGSVFTTQQTVRIDGAPLEIQAWTGASDSSDYLLGTSYYSPATMQIEVTTLPIAAGFVSGADQSAPIGEAFAQPAVFELRNRGQPTVGSIVTFTVQGGTLSSANPVLTDANGQAAVNVVAGPNGGPVVVTATAAGLPPITTQLYAQELSLQHVTTAAQNDIHVALTNGTPPQGPLPYVLMASLPGITPLQTAFGPVATNPFDPATVVLEDSIGAFGFVSLSGTGLVGSPSANKTYSLPPGFLSGLTLQFQAVGLDPTRGLFRTNVATLTF